MSTYLPPLAVSAAADRNRARADAGIKWCAGLLLIAFFLRASSIPTPLSPSHLFLACCAGLVLAFVYMLATRAIEINALVGVFILLLVPSLLEAEDAEFATFRLFGWILLMAVVGPLFSNEIRLKTHVLKWTRILVTVCAVGSLILNLAGIRLAGRGIFFGLMGHTMLLAPVSALAAIDLFGRRKQARSRFNTVLLALCCITCVGAGSRGAVLGMVCGILVHASGRREGIYTVAMGIVGLLAVSMIQLNREEKYSHRLDGGVYAEIMEKGTSNTRGELWGARIKEFRSSPLLGVGFQQQRIYREGADRKFLEPGSGYLAVLSMTGLVGAVGFSLLLLKLLQTLYRPSCAIPVHQKDLLRGWMVFFLVHFVFEGYIFACGSLLCFLFWLTAGCAMSFDHMGLRLKRQRHRESRIAKMRKMAAA